jgi:hypothetical protein
MNNDDKNSLKTYKSMFGALSQSVKHKYEEKARERSSMGLGEHGPSPHVRDATLEEDAIPAINWSPGGATDVVSLADIRSAKTRA